MMRRAFGCLLFILLACPFSPAQTHSDIREAWKKLAVHSIEYEYRVRDTLAVNGRTLAGLRDATFVLDHPKYRATLDGPSPNPDDTTISHLVVYDGVDYRSCFRSRGTDQVSGGLVRNNVVGVNLTWFLPVKAAHSPDTALLYAGVKLEDLEIVSDRELVDGRDCLALAWKGTEAFPAAAKRFFLDPSRCYALVAAKESSFGKPTSEMNFIYGSKGDTYVLNKWQLSRFDNDGELQSHTEISVQEVALSPSLDPGTFAFEYPEGAIVAETRGQGETVLLKSSNNTLTELDVASVGHVNAGPRLSAYLFLAMSTVVVLATFWLLIASVRSGRFQLFLTKR